MSAVSAATRTSVNARENWTQKKHEWRCQLPQLFSDFFIDLHRLEAWPPRHTTRSTIHHFRISEPWACAARRRGGGDTLGGRSVDLGTAPVHLQFYAYYKLLEM